MKFEQIPIVLGTTATGKTGVSIALAKHIDGELINADARAIISGYGYWHGQTQCWRTSSSAPIT